MIDPLTFGAVVLCATFIMVAVPVYIVRKYQKCNTPECINKRENENENLNEDLDEDLD